MAAWTATEPPIRASASTAASATSGSRATARPSHRPVVRRGVDPSFEQVPCGAHGRCRDAGVAVERQPLEIVQRLARSHLSEHRRGGDAHPARFVAEREPHRVSDPGRVEAGEGLDRGTPHERRRVLGEIVDHVGVLGPPDPGEHPGDRDPQRFRGTAETARQDLDQLHVDGRVGGL